MKAVAQYVLPDEPCWGLYEGPTLVPQFGGGTVEHWVQDVTVIRGDRKAHYLTDFGPVENFAHVAPLMMPSAGENSVAELQEWAAKNRQDDYWSKRAEEMLASSTLAADAVRQQEQIEVMVKNRSSFGPGITVQRATYNRAATQRKFNERRAVYHGRKVF